MHPTRSLVHCSVSAGDPWQAHANELPLLYLATFKQLRLLLERELGEHASGRERLEALQQVVRGMPGFVLARGDMCIGHAEWPATEYAPAADGSTAEDGPPVVVVRIPSAEGELPSLERVAGRPDYLHVLAAALSATAVQIMPLQPPKGQVGDPEPTHCCARPCTLLQRTPHARRMHIARAVR